MRGLVFSKRTAKEILRDPLTFIFCLGFPIFMLVIMTIVNKSISKEAAMRIFQMDYLAPGIVLFGFTFIMQFTCLQVSKDRCSSFLLRLYASPMKPLDFIIGYTFPVLGIAFLQSIVTFAAAFVVAGFAGETLSVFSVIVCIPVLLPAALLFMGMGMLFGTLLNEKAGPGICSVMITAACLLGGIWMDVDALGGIIKKVSHAFPFYHAVEAARMAVSGHFEKVWKPCLIVAAFAAAFYLLAVFVFKNRMQKDLR